MTNATFLPEQLEFVDRGDGSGRTLIGVHDALTQTAAKFWRYPPERAASGTPSPFRRS